jgi:hypothetical protein
VLQILRDDVVPIEVGLYVPESHRQESLNRVKVRDTDDLMLKVAI